MTDTDKAQIAALGSTRLGTLEDYRRMWTAQREAQGLPASREDWEAWLVERLRETEDLRKLWSEETAHLRGVLVAEAEAREALTAKLAQAVDVMECAQRILGRLAYPRADDNVSQAEVVAVETAIRSTLAAIKGGDNG